MTVSLKHAFTSNVADSGDATLVQPSNWNAEHNLTANANSLLGTVTAGSVTEISCTSAGRDLLDDADASAQRTTLGLGSIATQNANNVTITGGSITGITDLAVADGGTGASTLTGYIKGNGTAAFTASNTIPNTNITGLGTISTQNANNVSITGGSITGITDLAVVDGGTGASSAAAAATNLGLGTGDSPQFAGVNIGNATDTTITRVSAGVIAVEGNQVPSPGSVAQGDIIYYGGSTWDRLGAGTSGQLLKTNGVGANPSWSDPVIPSGSVMLFQQTAAPTGWTKLTTHNNKALRVVSGTASSGGTVAFTTAFASQSVSGTISSTTAGGTVGSTTLTTAQMPSHNHTYTAGTGIVTATGTAVRLNNLTAADLSNNTGSTGGGGSHNHSFTGTSHTHTFTGTAIDLAVQYVDIILASKD